jgi:TDG/mug DNA glycosylase family protein
VQRASRRTIPDVIAPDLDVLFCGINPGLYSAAVGHHFARAGNRFWPVLHASGFTPRLYSPFEDRELLALGCGITNIVDRASASADMLSRAELQRGAVRLARKLRRYRPRLLVVLGLVAYRAAFDAPRAVVGLQPARCAETPVWVLPNPSGLNAHFQIPALTLLFAEVRHAVKAGSI